MSVLEPVISFTIPHTTHPERGLPERGQTRCLGKVPCPQKGSGEGGSMVQAGGNPADLCLCTRSPIFPSLLTHVTPGHETSPHSPAHCPLPRAFIFLKSPF